MRTLLFGIVLALMAATASAQSATVRAGESRVFPVFDATAAWAVDATVVEVTVQQGKVILFGRVEGRTTIIISTARTQQTFDVTVLARPGTTAASAKQQRAGSGTAEMRYSSAAREIQAGASMVREEKNRRTEVNVRTVSHIGTPEGDRARTSIASASYRIFTRRRELTVFDRDVDHSPLTLEATPLRGIHYLDDHWRLHAGYTAYAAYRVFLIPIERQLVAGGGYAFRASSRSTVTPAFFAVRGKGSIASLLYDYNDQDRLTARAELGYSRGFGGAAELHYDGDDDEVRASLRYRPDHFAVAGISPRGFFGDTSWSHRYGRGSTASASWSATDVGSNRVLSGAVDFDHRLSNRVSLIGGGTWAKFNDIRALSIPSGVQFDFRRGSAGAIYRYTRSHTNRGGNGLRLFGRVSVGHVYASAYADRQESVPTLEVIFSERPDLATALAELGITANSPADIARALRENVILANLGFIDGITIELAPSRTQFGFEAAWLGGGESRQQLRLRLLHNVIESVASRRTMTLGSISYSRRLTSTTDVFASWSYWRTNAGTQPFAEMGLRQRFDGLPSLFGGSGTISGIVFLDENLDGQSDGSGVVAEVELDGQRKQRTNADGTFAFKGVPRGSHRVTARIPDKLEAYFTMASSVEAQVGERVAFGVATTPARLFGIVKNDAGLGIGGVRVLLVRGAQRITTTTESDGEFAIAATPGEWQFSVIVDSLPAGYALARAEARMVMLDRAQPLRVEETFDALRTIRGRIDAHAEILVRPLDMRIRADAEGRFIIRSLPSGPVTLSSGGETKSVDVPAEPAALTVDFTSDESRH